MDQIRKWRIKTYSRWINARIIEKFGPTARLVRNFQTELRDGAFLMNLALALWDIQNPKYVKPTTLAEMEANTLTAFRLLATAGVNVHWFSAADIASGNVDATLNLIWLIIMHSDMKRFLPNKPVETSLEAMTRDCNAQFIQWVQRRLVQYTNVVVNDLTTSFRDGIALCALVHFMRVDSMNYLLLTPSEPQKNLIEALNKALAYLKVPALVEPGDFIAPGPDESCVMCYLAELLKYYRKKWGRPGYMPEHMRFSLPAAGTVPVTAPGAPMAKLPATRYEKGKVAWEIPYDELKFDKEIGRGAFGQVFLGKWRMQTVAIKRLLLKGAKMSEKEMDEFMAECELMMSLRPHKNVVQLLGVCFNPEQPMCVVTDFQPGGSLQSLLRSDKKIEWPAVINVLQGVSAGMYHIHREKILHRDLAARNILLNAGLDAMVADFGLSAKVTGDSAQETYFRGALKYMAPESLKSNMFSTKTDVWSFGVLTWEVLTRKAPFADMDIYAAAKKIKKGMTLPMPMHCPSTVALMLEQCWCAEPDARPAFDQLQVHFTAMSREHTSYPPLPLLLPGEAAARRESMPVMHTGESTSHNNATNRLGDDSDSDSDNNNDSNSGAGSGVMRRATIAPRSVSATAASTTSGALVNAGSEREIKQAVAAASAQYATEGDAHAKKKKKDKPVAVQAQAGDGYGVMPSPNRDYDHVEPEVPSSPMPKSRSSSSLANSDDHSGYGPAPASLPKINNANSGSSSSISISSTGSNAANTNSGRNSSGGGGGGNHSIRDDHSGYGVARGTAPDDSSTTTTTTGSGYGVSGTIAGIVPSDSESSDDDPANKVPKINVAVDDGGNQYDILPQELEAARRLQQRGPSTVDLGAVMNPRLVSAVKNATLPSRASLPVESASTKIAAHRNDRPKPRLPSSDSGGKKPRAAAPTPPSAQVVVTASEYGNAPPSRESSAGKEKTSSKSSSTAAPAAANTVDESGYAAVPPPSRNADDDSDESGEAATPAISDAEAMAAGYGIAPKKKKKVKSKSK